MAENQTTHRVIVNAGDVWDLWQSMRTDTPFPITLPNGEKVELVAGSPSDEQIGRTYAQMEEFEVRRAGL